MAYGYYYLGKSYYNQGKYNKSIAVLLEGLEIEQNPDYYKVKIYKQLALNYNAIENHIKKRKFADLALIIHNDYWQPESVKEEIELLKKLSE